MLLLAKSGPLRTWPFQWLHPVHSAQDMSPSKVFLMKHLEEAKSEDGRLLMPLESSGACDPTKPPTRKTIVRDGLVAVCHMFMLCTG